ncbi:MAG: thioesterase family protein [Micromonosporaceae bacterium]
MASFEYDRDTAVTPDGTPGGYAATLTDRWSLLNGIPYGGYALGVALRALAAEVDQPDPLVVSAYFLRRATPGPAELTTEVVRRGRRITTGEVRLTQDGAETLRVVANFTDLTAAQGRTTVFGEPPKLPPPEQCHALPGGIPGLTIRDRYEYRYPEPPGWQEGKLSGDPHAELWVRFTDGRDPDVLSLPAIADAAPPAVMELGEWRSTIELTVHLRAHPAPGWLACRVATRYIMDGYHEEDVELWDSAGTLVAQGRQLALLPPKQA